VGFSWARNYRDISVVSCLAYIHKNVLNSHLDDSTSNFRLCPWNIQMFQVKATTPKEKELPRINDYV